MNGKVSIKGITKRPPAVDFIDHRLPKYHQAFVNPPVHFDMELQKYIPDFKDAGSIKQMEPLQNSRPPPSLVEAMEFWNAIFPEAMSELEKSSKITMPSLFPYSIRTSKKWEEVQERLSAARAAYEGPKGSITSYIRRGIHKMGENSLPVKRALDFVKDIQYISPVVGVVQIVLDVSCTVL